MIVLIDIIILLFVSYFSNRIKTISFYNPMFWVICYHGVMVSFRLIQLDFLNAPLYSFNQAIQIQEIYKAVLLSDIALISFFAAYCVCFSKVRKVSTREIKLYLTNEVKFILLIIFGVGFFAFKQYLLIPQFLSDSGLDLVKEKNFLFYANSWILYGLILLIYIKGFKKIYFIPALVFLFILIFQGESRFRILLPIIMLTTIFLHKNNMRFPKLKYIVLGFLFVIFVFFPMKRIAWLVQSGGSVSDVLDISLNSYKTSTTGENTEMMLLDMSAATLTLIDDSHTTLMGESYFTFLYMFIPRIFWEEKPALTQWMYDISTSGRNLAKFGTAPSLVGESYANFGYVGVILLPFIYGSFMFFFYKRILKLDRAVPNVLFLLYIIYLSIMVQVLRDGIISLLVFPFITYAPLTYYSLYRLIKNK